MKKYIHLGLYLSTITYINMTSLYKSKKYVKNKDFYNTILLIN